MNGNYPNSPAEISGGGQSVPAAAAKVQSLNLKDPRWLQLPDSGKETVQRGEAAWERLCNRGSQTYADWREVANAVQTLRSKAMSMHKTNDVNSKRYRNEMSSFITLFSLGSLSKATRHALLNLTPEVDAWHARLPPERQADLNHPVTVLRQYRRAMRAEQKGQLASQTKTITFHDEVDDDENHLHSALDFSDLSEAERRELRESIRRFARKKGIEVDSALMQTSS
jgi:hypothetical protein